MCGIVGYVGTRSAEKILVQGLKRLEYRGYDSAGIALIDAAKPATFKSKGKVAELEKLLGQSTSKIGIGHTRWATHGEPNDANAHPHTYEKITLVHNGIIENYQTLKDSLLSKGATFKSDTDTEVIAVLLNELRKEYSIEESIEHMMSQVIGTFGLLVLDSNDPNTIFVARRGSPVLLGIGKTEMFIASDGAALAEHTDRVVYLEDNQYAKVQAAGFELFDGKSNRLTAEEHELEHDVLSIQKNGYAHFLIKEIFEQPQTIENCLRGRIGEDGEIYSDGLDAMESTLRTVERIMIIGCGTAYFSGMLGKYLLEKLTGLPVDVEYGSEFRYRDAAIDPQKTLAIFMSQSGETADTLASLEKIKRLGVPSFGLINVVGSTLAREVDEGMYLHAGPEISVASTKAYSAMVSGLLMVGLHIARLHGLPRQQSKELAQALISLPTEILDVLERNKDIKQVAKKIANFDHAFFLGREALYPAALEGALKLMEVSYMQAQPYPAGEMKHGPIALIEPDFLSVALLPEDEELYLKSISNIEEIKARKGSILIVGSRPPIHKSDWAITTPKVSAWIEPLVINVALQLLAYHVAVERGTDVDQPRNLAKSVTVE